MPKKIISFGNYVFPDIQGSLNSNFTDGVQRIQRMPDADGGFDNDGESPFKSEVGSIQLGFTLVARDRDEMEAKRDAVKALRSSRPQKLYMRPAAASPTNRWCMAKVLNIRMPEDLSANTDLFQPVTITFSVSDPFWYGQGTEAATLGPATLLGNFTLGGSPDVFAVHSGGSFTVSIGGNVPVLPRIAISSGSFVSTDVTLQRLINGLVVDEIFCPAVRYLTAGAGPAGDYDINCRTKTVLRRKELTANYVDAYDIFDAITADWIRLDPGDNTFNVITSNPSIAITFKFYYYEKYR